MIDGRGKRFLPVPAQDGTIKVAPAAARIAGFSGTVSASRQIGLMCQVANRKGQAHLHV